jgi:hypothetical protein
MGSVSLAASSCRLVVAAYDSSLGELEGGWLFPEKQKGAKDPA